MARAGVHSVDDHLNVQRRKRGVVGWRFAVESVKPTYTYCQCTGILAFPGGSCSCICGRRHGYGTVLY